MNANAPGHVKEESSDDNIERDWPDDVEEIQEVSEVLYSAEQMQRLLRTLGYY